MIVSGIYPVSWQRVTSITVLLVPAAWLFRAAVKFRRKLYAWNLLGRERVAVPVIVVGNISVGGTGKTPLVLWLADFLRHSGYQPGIVSRGYGAAATQARPVDAAGDASDYGDEPLLLARRSGCPVWVGADRVAAARALLARHPDCNILISDDGLQHYRLARDIEIAVVDAGRAFGNGFTLPAGPLREPVSRLKSVDLVVCNGEQPPPELKLITAFRMTLEGLGFYQLRQPARWVPATHFLHRRVHAVAGIGNPQRFFDTLQAMGLAFTPHAFPDHHAYAAGDLQFADGGTVLMTEKDAVKCAAFSGDEHWALRVSANIDPEFGARILQKLGSKS